ncbi:MAG: OmpA family protein [Bacteroidales bacterium]|nr:OmpA family protein [Bacteroidales bacterium]
MKHILSSLALILFLTATAAMAQVPENDTANVAAVQTDEEGTQVVFPRNLIGIRGGLNLSDMIYSQKLVDRYKHYWQPQGMLGLFGHFHLGNSNLSLRPEVTLIGRADSLQWKDVEYRMKAHYVDFRLPLTYNFRIDGSHVSPYLMVVPEFGMAYGGKIGYHADDFPNGVTAKVTKADINRFDAGVMFGAGIDFLVETKSIPLLLSVEAGYNMGLLNTFAQREIKDNPDIAEADRSIIANRFFGAELWQKERKNRGVEVALRIALPLDGSWKQERKPLAKAVDTTRKAPDTVFIVVVDTTPKVPDTVYIGQPAVKENDGEGPSYVHKDCYSFSEMYAFITLGIDISDKRICLFNINFDFDSYRLRPESKQPLYDVAMMMKAYPEMLIKVYGHTDSLGTENYNNVLSLQRANAVIKYLKSQGIDGSRMEPEGCGKKYPIDTNQTPQGRFRNRRVEIEVMNVGMRITDYSDKKETE